MENNLINEMSQLNCLLKKHKQLQERSAFKSFYQSDEIENNINIFGNLQNDYNSINYKEEKIQSSITNKVYLNPNYKNKKNVIYINPNIQVKSSIYVNPKLIKIIATAQNQEKETRNYIKNNECITHSNQHSKVSVHVNPKLMTKLISNVPKQNDNISNLLNIYNAPFFSTLSNKQSELNSSFYNIQNNCTKSIPSNIKKISTMFVTPSCESTLSTDCVIKSKPKIVNNGGNYGKNSNLVLLSQRKLVRIKKNPKIITTSKIAAKLLTISRRKLSCSGLKKVKSSQKNSLNTINHLKKTNNIKLIQNIDKYTTNWNNKFNKTVSILNKKKLISAKKVMNNSVGLVSIGGILYKTSRNQLVRSNCNVSSLKRKRNLILNKSSQYYITKNGKKLLKKDLNKKKIYNSLNKVNMSILPIKNYKTNVCNKVKQRSLQILRNKMRKNNQPCLLFQRFGYCANQLAKTCPKVHDKKQVALCKNFLQGTCFLDNCQLSHNIGPEKMPTCKYFLDGCCTRDGCPYLHVKVSSKNPICVEFLRGYCSQGNECQKRHIYACPEFDKNGKCSKGNFCEYPHNPHFLKIKKLKIATCFKNNEMNNEQSRMISKKSEAIKCRKRYYDKTNEDLFYKREKLTKLVKIMKNMHTVQVNFSTKETSVIKNEIGNDSKICKKMLETYKKQRTPIGSLPAYIPIN